MKLVDEIVKEPLGGAHKDRDQTFTTVSNKIMKSYDEFKNLSPKELLDQRMEKYAQMGVFKD
jgi:acetyl-CoA carboxylase carboxyl transferase subunit alpha